MPIEAYDLRPQAASCLAQELGPDRLGLSPADLQAQGVAPAVSIEGHGRRDDPATAADLQHPSGEDRRRPYLVAMST